MCVLLAQLCPSLCDPMDCGPPGSLSSDVPGQNTGAGCHSLLQGIFLTQCREILYCLSHPGSHERKLSNQNEANVRMQSKEDLTVLRQAYLLKECGPLGTAVTHRVPSGLVVRPQINF